MVERSAATQMTPGPMARSWLGSAPTPSGKRLATMMKKRSAGEAGEEVEVLVRSASVLGRGRVANVDQLARVLLGEAEDRRAAPAHFALRRREQAAEDAQKAGLAAAVRAGDAHEIAAGDAERESAEERAAASLAVEPLRLQH